MLGVAPTPCAPQEWATPPAPLPPAAPAAAAAASSSGSGSGSRGAPSLFTAGGRGGAAAASSAAGGGAVTFKVLVKRGGKDDRSKELQVRGRACFQGRKMGWV